MKIDKYQVLTQVNKSINDRVNKKIEQKSVKSNQSDSLESLLQAEFIDQHDLNAEQSVKKFIKVVLIKALGVDIIDHSKYSDMNQSIYDALKSQSKTLNTLISEIKDCVK
ncbi:MAG: hypothetical protein HRU38_13960 [Saccharospirillaceae bacterium]|nr:hypothetical protein [Pseudomonadales bacterium]NRB79751.1 hypothetical protein [Saccharospirillaceae bacterium]